MRHLFEGRYARQLLLPLCLLNALSASAQAVYRTSITLAQPASPVNVSQAVTLTATVTPVASGNVTFKAGADVLGVVAVSLAQMVARPCVDPMSTASLAQAASSPVGGIQAQLSQAGCTPSRAQAQLTIAAGSLSPGRYTLSASFLDPEGVYGAASLSGVLPTLVVLAAPQATSTALSSSANPVGLFQPLTLTARVSPATASGNVSFWDGAQSLGTAPLSAGQASVIRTLGTLGQHNLMASYAGDAAHQASQSPYLVEQVQASAALPPLPAPAAPVQAFEYDALGNPTRTTLAPESAAFSTQHRYDALSRRINSTDPLNGQTAFAYDGQDQLTQVTDPRRLVTRYSRDGLGGLRQLDSPDTGTSQQVLDAAGRLSSRTDSRGVQASYQYDALGRTNSVVYSQAGQASQSYSWTYDETGSNFSNGIGRLTTARSPAGSSQYRHDPWGRITQQTQRITTGASTGASTGAPDVVLVSGYGYDAAGHISSISYPSGAQLTLSYQDGLLTSIQLGATQPLLSQIRYAPFGPLQSWVWPFSTGAQLNERWFDSSGRLLRYRLGDLMRDLDYDAADRLISYKHYAIASGAAQPALDQSFAYDALGRLASVFLSGSNSSWSIAYDANGNRSSVTLNGQTRNYTTAATSNRLLALSNPARSFNHDPAGNTTTDSALYSNAIYGLDGRLAQLEVGSAKLALAYDAQGQRVRRSISGAGGNPNAGNTFYAYDQEGQLLGEYRQDAAGQLITLIEYVWLDGQPVAAMRPMAVAAGASSANAGVEVFYLYSDHLGAPRVAVDDQGRTRWRWLAEPFGSAPAETDPSGLGDLNISLRLPGQQYDGFLGLHFNGFRDYDAGTGRYVQSDPIGLAGGVNTYAYVEGNPVSYVDPEGLQKGPAAPGTYYPRGSMPRPPSRSDLPGRTAQEAAASMGATPNPSFPGDPLDMPCLEWYCPQSASMCSRRDYMKSSDFLPPATSTADAPDGCRCVRPGRDPAWQRPFDPNIDPYANARDVMSNWKRGTSIFRRY
ncbi:RHS repeat-associated core domain-containing protein [Paucibacter sp. APW11]|uniref:RHS repeat-associated core domain-containing protein n=1 Tax=Roseateles aquae TaxID=3077235 RepID=A0ABU3PHK6_9BURK|nr:RHS repeat-associated core domain-containing protein [Paucibacter sp. APW11]MDT9001573.1 RHS repeat-associated core domain-containing protein [Paucibacter sp. APW11]